MAEEDLVIRGSLELDTSKADAKIETIERRPVKVNAAVEGAFGHVADPGTGFNPRPTNSGGIAPSVGWDPGRYGAPQWRPYSGPSLAELNPGSNMGTLSTHAGPGSYTAEQNAARRDSSAVTGPSSGAAGASPAAVARRDSSERAVASANDKLARATERQADAIERNAAAVERARVELAAAEAKTPADRAGVYRKAAAGFDEDSVESLRYRTRATQIEEAEARKSKVNQGRLGQLATTGFILQELGHVLQAQGKEGREERLAIGDRGGEDSLRKYRAYTATADSAASTPVVGGIVDYLVEKVTGFREEAQGKIEAAERQGKKDERRDRMGEARIATREHFKGVVGRNYANAGEGDYERGIRGAEVERDQALYEAEQSYQKGRQATPDKDRPELEANYAKVKESINRNFAVSAERIGRAYEAMFSSVTSEIPALAARAAGDVRGAARMEIWNATDLEARAQEDPTLKAAILRRGDARLSAFDTINGREDADAIADEGFQGQASYRRGSGDYRGSLVAGQAGRRRRELKDLLGPGMAERRKSRSDMLDDQDAMELTEFDRERGFARRGLEAQRDVTGLQADRKPYSAQAEGIFRRGSLSADQAAIESPANAITELEITRNQLKALANQIRGGGSGVEVDAGAYGPGGTEGSDQQGADITAGLSRIEELLQRIADASANMERWQDGAFGGGGGDF